MTFVLLIHVTYGQKKYLKPMFKICGIDSGSITVDNILTDDKIQANNSKLKIISANIYIVTLNKSHVVNNKGDRLDPIVISLLKSLPKGNSCKFFIDNVKTLKQNGDTLKLSNPLKIIVTQK